MGTRSWVEVAVEQGAGVGGPGPGLFPMGRACAHGHSRSAIRLSEQGAPFDDLRHIKHQRYRSPNRLSNRPGLPKTEIRESLRDRLRKIVR